MVAQKEHLHPDLVEQILLRLGFSENPPVNLNGLTSLYNAWCQRVPFDNIRKRIHLATCNPLPLPGHNDTDFFQGWLRYGVGGLCWAGNAALYALLGSLGFPCRLGTATMLTDNEQHINHGTVSVQLGDQQFLVDASMLHHVPLVLDPNKPSTIDHQAWGLTCSPQGCKWFISWRPLHMTGGCACRIEQFPETRDIFRQFNEVTRTDSPFNDSLYLRINDRESVAGISAGMIVLFSASGEIIKKPLCPESRRKFLIEKAGIKEEIITRIPDDVL